MHKQVCNFHKNNKTFVKLKQDSQNRFVRTEYSIKISFITKQIRQPSVYGS